MKPYYLLPIDFTRIADHEVVVNEFGDMLVLPIGSVAKAIVFGKPTWCIRNVGPGTITLRPE